MASLNSRDINNHPDSMELNYQKYLANVFMIIGLPVLGVFMIYDLIIGRYLIGTILVLMFVLLLCLFVAINKPGYKTKESQLYRGQFKPHVVGLCFYGAGVFCPGNDPGFALGVDFILCADGPRALCQQQRKPDHIRI